jgi:polyisoprenoid-binding protein YceI
VHFSVRHLVVGRVDGRLLASGGQLTVLDDPQRLFDRFEVTFDAASVDTHVKMRDDDLRSARFFDSETFPTITLAGGASEYAGDGRWRVEAQLTIRQVTRQVALDVAFRGMAVDARGKAKAALAVEAATQRSDFDLATELRQESGEPGSGPDIEIHADVEAFLRT